MNNIFDYVTRREATESKLISGVNCSPESALDEFRFVKRFNFADDQMVYDTVSKVGCEDFPEFGTGNAKCVRVADFVGEVIQVFIEFVQVVCFVYFKDRAGLCATFSFPAFEVGLAEFFKTYPFVHNKVRKRAMQVLPYVLLFLKPPLFSFTAFVSEY